jgi:putative membrane protein
MRGARNWWWAVAASAGLAMAAACSSEDTNDSVEAALDADAGTGGENIDLTDGQIAQVVLVANDGEVMLAQAVLNRAVDATVRDFNTRMVNEHTAARQRAEQLAQAQGIQLQDSPVAQHLQEEVMRLISALEKTPDAKFDLAAMDAQLTAHARTALTADALLAPQAQNPALQQELQAQRQTVQQHLLEAEALQNTLYGGDGGTPTYP